MWRHSLLLALGGFAVFADVDIDGTSDELSSNALAEEELEIESAVISLQSKEFAQALQAHPLLMVRHIINSHTIVTTQIVTDMKKQQLS